MNCVHYSQCCWIPNRSDQPLPSKVSPTHVQVNKTKVNDWHPKEQCPIFSFHISFYLTLGHNIFLL